MRFVIDFVLAVLIATALVACWLVTTGSGSYPAPKTYGDSHCIDHDACDNTTGCSWTGLIFTTWYPHGSCDPAFPAGTGANCTETYRLCRFDQYYAITPCFGPFTTSEYWEYGC